MPIDVVDDWQFRKIAGAVVARTPPGGAHATRSISSTGKPRAPAPHEEVGDDGHTGKASEADEKPLVDFFRLGF
jgi:hypothetical protein